jgi:hypothetical protein
MALSIELVGDVDDEACDVVVAGVGQDQHPEGPAGPHTDREGGDVLEGAAEPHLPQDGLAGGQPLSQLPGVRQAWWPDSRKSGAWMVTWRAAAPATGIGRSEGSAWTAGT